MTLIRIVFLGSAFWALELHIFQIRGEKHSLIQLHWSCLHCGNMKGHVFISQFNYFCWVYCSLIYHLFKSRRFTVVLTWVFWQLWVSKCLQFAVPSFEVYRFLSFNLEQLLLEARKEGKLEWEVEGWWEL